MSLTATILKGFQLVMPDGQRQDLNFRMPAPFKEKEGFSILSIELEHLDWDLRVIVQISHLDGSVAKECVGTHKETGEKHEFMFMPFYEARITNLNRRPVGHEPKGQLEQHPESTLHTTRPTPPEPFPSTFKFPPAKEE